jgi:hypothetical protein
MERNLLKTHGQFRTTKGHIVSYLGLTWDYSELGYVKVSQVGIIQDIIACRAKFHQDCESTGIPKTPAALHLYDRTPDCELLNAKSAENFWTEKALLAHIQASPQP